MKPGLLLAVVMAFGVTCALGSIWELRKMIHLMTGKDPTWVYGFYGCHCGLGGQGAPLDAIDQCCAKHDCCYNLLRRRGCSTKFLKYDFFVSGLDIRCNKNQDSCRRLLCQCDKILTNCLVLNQESYKSEYQYHLDLLCHGEKPACPGP